MGTHKGKLFELADMFHTYQNKKNKDERCRNEKQHMSLKGKHFDEGKSITLSYDLDMYPEVLNESHERQATASEMSLWSDERSEAFYVEPFDAEESVASAYALTPIASEATLDKIVTVNDDEYVPQPVSEELSHGELEKKLDKVVSPEEDTSSPDKPAAVNQQEEKQQPATDVTKTEDVQNQNATAAVKGNKGAVPYNVSDEEFAKDIGAILQGQKLYDSEKKKTVNKSENTRTGNGRDIGTQVPPAKDDALAPDKNEHKIFEKIAQSMQYANSYDLGAIALEKRFEQMDQELEKEEVDRLLQNKSTSQEKQKRDTSPLDDVRPRPKDKPTGAEDVLAEKYGTTTPLDETNGGRLVGIDDLQKGDLVLAASTNGAFGVMQGPLGSESIAGVYIGQAEILTKGDGDVLEKKKLQPELSGRGVMVVLRHQDMSSEKASNITTSLDKLRLGANVQADTWTTIPSPSITIYSDICNAQNSADKNKCSTWSGKIRLGTLHNDSFICAESVIDAFKNNQASFVSSSKEHNGTLKYFGHLKNKA